jgi:hypothetical protein
MTTESDVILERYRAVEKEADALGRVIGVRRLKPSEQTKIAGMTGDLTGTDEFDEVDAAGHPTGRKNQISQRALMNIAASACEIDAVRIPFPRNRGELDAILDRLDLEGLQAAIKAAIRLYEKQGVGAASTGQAAGNWVGTPSSG